MVDFSRYNELGFHTPYYFRKNERLVIENDFSSILEKYSAPLQIDEVAVAQLLNRGFLFGDRTLIKGIYRTPWMAKPNFDYTRWESFNLPKHGHKILSEDEIINEFFSRLRRELLDFVGDKTSICLLLTGGMDSRIVAGVLDYLIKNNELRSVRVLAVTWGNPESRDVIYAKEIAKRLNWDWQHFLVTPRNLIENVQDSIQQGCEFSPIHLHGMKQVKTLTGIDCVLAGSFGDSVGRAEFSGKHVLKIKPLTENFGNPAKFLRSSYVSQYQDASQKDLSKYHQLFPREEIYQQLELDYQCHYMRRMLNPCMAIINSNIPVYQVFTKPYVYEFIWSLDPDLRGNDLYKGIMKKFSTQLNDIPWSRTGLKYDLIDGQRDLYSKSNHDYGKMISEDLLDFIKEHVLSNTLASLGIFNMGAVETVLKMCRRHHIPDNQYYESRLIWLAGLSIMVAKYNIKGNGSQFRGLEKLKGKISAYFDFSLRKLYYKSK